MDNILKMNLDTLREVSAMISAETGGSLIICDHQGEIIEATDTTRIGRKHMGSIIIRSGQTDEAVIDEEQAEHFRKLGTDTNAGYSHVITVLGRRAGSLGLEGDPEKLKPIVRMAAKTIGIYISRYHKEKEKNTILEKMAELAGSIVCKKDNKIDFQVLTEDIRFITEARFAVLDLYDPVRDVSTLTAISGEEEDLREFEKILKGQVGGIEFSRSDIYIKKLQNNRNISFNSFVYFSQEFIPLKLARTLENQFELGKVTILEIACQDKMIGNFSLLLSKETEIKNTEIAELYAAQVGQLLVRTQTETALRMSKGELKRARYILDSFLEHSPNPICILDTKGNVIRVSSSGAKRMGLTPKMMEGTNVAKMFSPAYFELFDERIREVNKNNRSFFYSDSMSLPSGKEGYMEYCLFPIDNQEDQTSLIGMVAYDVTRSREAEEKLKFISYHDAITGLNNRLFFEMEIKNLPNCQEDYPLTVLSIDVDGLKAVNETMGHEYGNQLLRELSRILENSIRNNDLLARTGGDEFAVVLYKTDQKAAESVVTRIIDNIVEHNRQSSDISISVSIGQATAYSAEENINEIFKKADEHMYHNKLFQKQSSRSQIINSLMAALAERDYITQGHANRLLDLSVKVGTRKVLDPRMITALALLSQVHDVGKVGIPDRILFKPGKLTEEEWEVMRMHPEKGYRIAIVSPDLKDIAELILKHHERWDGKGYPLGLKGEDIPLECRILSVVDSFDAMTSERPYSKPKSKEEAVQEIKRCSGTQFDPEIVELFIKIIDEDRVS